ncbi:MAG: alpha/beta hydrolase [Cyclobacteriaceae bacterium]
MRFITLFLLCFVHWSFGQTVDHNGVNIAYQSEGDSDTTLLFIHGWAINQTYWQPQTDHFKDRYRVVTLDLAGHGKSGNERNDWSMEAFGNDVVAVIEKLDLQHIVLIGHSMGGTVMLEAATKVPDRVIALVGVDNFKDVGAEITAEQQQEVEMFLGMMETNYAEVVDGYTRGMLFTPESDSTLVDSVVKDIRNANQSMARNSLKNLFDASAQEVQLLQEAPAKLYLIQSDATPTDKKPLRKYLKEGYEILSVGKVSHYPMVEVPELFNEQLEEILHTLRSS